MTGKEIVQALRRLRVDTGSLACLGCGREHNCGTHGCARATTFIASSGTTCLAAACGAARIEDPARTADLSGQARRNYGDG